MNAEAIDRLPFDFRRVERVLTAYEELVVAVDLWIWSEELKAP